MVDALMLRDATPAAPRSPGAGQGARAGADPSSLRALKMSAALSAP